MARSKADALLAAPPFQTVLLYHATDATQTWASGSRDADFPGIVRRVLRGVGGLLLRSVATRVLDFLCELSADRHGRYISPAVAENIRERMRGGGGPGHLPATG